MGIARDVLMATSLTGLGHCESGAFNEKCSLGYGALRRVIRDGPPPCG